MSLLIRLEVAVETVAGLRAAVRGGADRIELVSSFGVGGVTPSVGLMRVVATCGVPVRAMIRPRAGDFTYTPEEVILMMRDIESARECGVAGVVIGGNMPNGELDEGALVAVTEEARNLGLDTAIHRSFNLAPYPVKAIDLCISLGMKTILTSGGPRYAKDGTVGLAHYTDFAEGRIEIMAGSGVTADNVGRIAGAGVSWVHASCQTVITASDHPPEDRVAALSGLTDARKDTDIEQVSRLRAALNEASVARMVIQ